MKRIISGILIVALVIVGAIFLYFNFNKDSIINMNGPQVSLLLNQVENQGVINNRLNKIAKSKKYTLEEPYVELNPYKISPLSAIIIFNTENSSMVDVYINDEFVTKMEESYEHVIPIYGLYEDFNNIVKLVVNGEEKEISIKTTKSNIEYPLNVEYAVESLNNKEMYFTVASYKTYLTAWDTKGKLRFYLTVDNRMDVEWLNNGHFLIGTSQGQFAENFCAFVEMDYLGKIYNYYVPEYGYSFEFQELSDGNIMMAGGNNPVYIDEQVIHVIDRESGDTISSLNIADVIRNIDSSFDELYLGQKAIRNSFYYNEQTKELLVSFRGWDAILSINYETKELNWIFTDPANELFANPCWKPYLVTLRSGRYPLGQHSLIFTMDGNIAFFNNGYNRLHGFENGGNDLVSAYINNYSSGEVYTIKNKTATLLYSYDESHKYFSHQYGSVRELSNGNYLINFGYNLKDEYRSLTTAKLSEAESKPDDIYALIVETDKSGNVVFKARSEEGKFRAFKHSLYDDITTNSQVHELNIFNRVKKDKMDKTNYKEVDLNGAQEWIYSFDLTENTLTTNYPILDTDKIDLYFANKKGDVFIMNYKDAKSSKKNRIFNLDLANDNYRIFISLNDTLYKIDTIYTEKHE